ncbi:MAG: phosphoglucosamine mutase [Rhodospirillaceae bacterium]|nr:phosphoglucosamine mutase [Rhodospirillaceae bacterium]MBT6137579.1 phosphoglucosamine mutase [Rhodospirillaceae bacterium]
MSRKLFGTDGIRGTANTEPMTAETALRVAMAAGRHFVPTLVHRPLAVIGKDTRLSGYMLEPAMVAGFVSIGMDVVLVGPMPTPAVAMLTRSLRADLGVMLSASHNPFEDNGIKLFGPDGYKLSDEVESEIELMMQTLDQSHRAPAGKLGRARRLEDARGRYIEFAKTTFPKGMRLEGLKLVVDCANGAAYKVAPAVLYELGAEVVPLAIDPDGFNINHECGATAPDALSQAVVAHGADLGIALDGDADRLIMVDDTGEIVDGDQIMGLIAASWHASGRLQGGGIVATVMSNLGLERFLNGHGLDLIRTAVGDRYVLERMRTDGYNVGGEQSGHMILSDHATTGDGLVAALQVLAELVESGRSLREAANVFSALPQILKNVRFSGNPPLDADSVKQAVRDGEERLAGTGRVLIRKSGTEPLIRVMAEGEDEGLVSRVVDDIIGEIERTAS